jgi:hypothetical protein
MGIVVMLEAEQVLPDKIVAHIKKNCWAYQ